MRPFDWLRRLQKQDKAFKMQVKDKGGWRDVKPMTESELQLALLESRRRALDK